jgi:predicted GNAT superfamily acetyltransferase
MRRVEALFSHVWQPANSAPPLAYDVIQALVVADSCYAAGAFADDQLVGACVGFWGRPLDRSLHSHLAAVAPDQRGRSIGYAMKLDQRAHAVESSVEMITWTYDPLVARNAHLNLHLLGAKPITYHVNFYGSLVDGINGTDDSDRFLVRWDLASQAVRRTCDQDPAQLAEPDTASPPALERSDVGAPRAVVVSTADRVTVAVPRDIERLRQEGPGLAREWRVASRSVLIELLETGASIVDFDKVSSRYIAHRVAQ